MCFLLYTYVPLICYCYGETESTEVAAQDQAISTNYENRSESKERFAIQRYLLIIGKKKNMQVLSHTFTYFST